MERSVKLRKISDARASLPHVSQNALSALIAKAKNGELPDTYLPKDIRAARNLQNNVVTPYGPLLIKDSRVVLNIRWGGRLRNAPVVGCQIDLATDEGHIPMRPHHMDADASIENDGPRGPRSLCIFN